MSSVHLATKQVLGLLSSQHAHAISYKWLLMNLLSGWFTGLRTLFIRTHLATRVGDSGPDSFATKNLMRKCLPYRVWRARIGCGRTKSIAFPEVEIDRFFAAPPSFWFPFNIIRREYAQKTAKLEEEPFLKVNSGEMLGGEA